MALADNRAGDLSTFDPAMLAGLQAEGVSLDGLWTGDELDALLSDLPAFEETFPDTPAASLAEPSPAYKEMIAGAAERGAANDRRNEEEMRLRRENTQASEVSPRPPSADTEPYVAPAAVPEPTPGPVPGLDRVTPDQETSRPGLFLHFRGLKIPVSDEEGKLLDARLAAYRESAGTFYGFVGSVLEQKPEQKPEQEQTEKQTEEGQGE